MARRIYAVDTEISVTQTKGDIETLLQKYGADQFYSGWQENQAAIGFRLNGLQYVIKLPLPNPTRVQDCKSRWRALFLVIKAKLVAAEQGISSVEREFFSDLRTYDGSTMYEHLKPQIEEMYQSGKMPQLLLSA